MKRGITDITNPRRGNIDIQKVYRGSVLVYSRTPPPPQIIEDFQSLVSNDYIINDNKYQTLVNNIYR